VTVAATPLSRQCVSWEHLCGQDTKDKQSVRLRAGVHVCIAVIDIHTNRPIISRADQDSSSSLYRRSNSIVDLQPSFDSDLLTVLPEG
jgi:hypothetical protein